MSPICGEISAATVRERPSDQYRDRKGAADQVGPLPYGRGTDWFGTDWFGKHLCKLAAMVVLMTAPVAVAEVKFSLSPEPYYIGAPISLSIEVINEPNHDPPVIPEIKNADIRGPSKAENISMLNFKVTKTVTYNYEIFPRRLGPLVIPSIEIVVGGKARQTSPRTLNIIKADAQDLLFVEINANRKSLYLGESIALTLEIWLKPFHDRRQRFGSTADMQECIDFRGSSWGPFGESLKDLRKLSVRKQRRADAKGNKQLYYVYRLKRTWWPEKSGPLDPGEVNIIVQYPLEVHRQRSLLFNQVRVTHAKPLAMQADVAPIMVKPIPTQGQPPWYNGAVGRYKFEVTAKPTKVHVGDPITLTMSLQGAGRLELLQAPRLDKVELLVEQFKIPDEMLAGAVQGSVKRFTQTIRARSDSVEEIPPIPFTCFDTKAKKFVTLYSDPIPIEVAASGRLAVSTMVESEIGPRVSTRLTRRGEGILANYTNLDDLLVSQGFAPSPATVAWLASPPVLFLLTTLVRRRRERLKYDVAYAARRSAKSTAMRSLGGSGSISDPREEAALVLGAVTQYVANRSGLSTSSLTRAEAVQLLRNSDVADEKIRSVDVLLLECENLQYGGSGSRGGESLSARGRECIIALEKERF